MPLLLQDDEAEVLEAALSFVEASPALPSADTPTPGEDLAKLGETQLDLELNRLLLETLSSSSDHENDANAFTTVSGVVLPAPLPPMVANVASSTVTNQGSQASRSRGPITSLAKPKRRVKANPNRARNERKHELAYLKTKVEQMESELEAMRRRVRARGHERPLPTPLRALTASCPSSPMSSSTTPHIWRDIATRQQKRREKSERENARLKLVLESQVKLAKSMETLLQKRARQQVSGCADVVDSSEDYLSQGSTLDLLIDKDTFEELLASVETAYAELDAVFSTNGLLGLDTPCRDARMREGASGMYLDVFANKVLPFGYEAVAAAVWNHFKGNNKHRGTVYENATKPLERVSDTVIESFTMEFTGKTTKADFRVKQVHRRYVESDREVVVWVSIGQALDQANSPFNSFGYVDKGYVVTRRPTTISAEHGQFTILQMCSLASPQMAAGFNIDFTAAGDFTEFVLNVVALNTTFNQELIENVLLEQGLSKRHKAQAHCA